MQSYPSEFTAHHVPLLFLAGLGGPVAEPSEGDKFGELVGALRQHLGPKKGFHVWDSTRGVPCEFHVALVDKNVRFPPLKARPASEQPTAAPHSPISPLSPSSPLFPDGIMAPIWIRKHREMVPAVFVLVQRLYEYAPAEGPLEGVVKKEEEERKRDAELVREVVERKRATIERGIKLAVILLCDRTLLDDPALDARLSLIRRQSGLDSRASLFVISPVPTSEVINFVDSLRAELFPAALDYYREHGRRVRRKRARTAPKGKLSDKGWNVRYDYKMGMFSEMRGEVEVALKHYEDCYETLVEMFSHTELLTPRTKRWAEAKVLSDCLTFKICKMYLYLNESSRSVAQLNRHVSRFRELSNTWGLGEQTFEFWSWLSKQYRLFAELVSIAIRSGFRLPSLRPPPPPRAAPAGVPQPNTSGLVPQNILQHAGYYFYLSATCAVERRDRFRAVVKFHEEKQGGAELSPAIVHETKVDHAEIIIDLFTKAYELFKSHQTSRMTLFIASQIALAHYQAGNHEMALKFHDRIATTYRKEHWRSILDPIVQLSLDSARQTNDITSAVRFSFELLAPDSRISTERRSQYAAELLELLDTTVPTAEQTHLVLDTVNVAPLFDCKLAFQTSTSDIGSPIPFQLSISSPANGRASSLVFSKLSIQFSDARPPLVLSHDSNLPVQSLEVYDIDRSQALSLSWADGSTKIVCGSVVVDQPIDLVVTSITLTLEVREWSIDVVLVPQPHGIDPLHWHTDTRDAAPQVTASVCHVKPRELKVDVVIEHAVPAYLDEEFCIHVDVVNHDSVSVEVVLDILLQPMEVLSDNIILVDEQRSSSFLKSVSLGIVAPSASARKAFRLVNVGSPGDRLLDLAIRATPSSLGDKPAVRLSFIEVLRTITIPAVHPFVCTFDTRSHQRTRAVKGLLDMSDEDGWEGARDVTLVLRMDAVGPWDVEVLSIDVACDTKRRRMRIVQSSIEQGSSFPIVWKPRDAFNVIYRLDVAPSFPPATPAQSEGLVTVRWRRLGAQSTCTTTIPLPIIDHSPLRPSITLQLPSFLTLHTPTDLHYRFNNPTERLLNLSTQVEGAEGFVFSGPRKFPHLVLAPMEERTITLSVIPLIVGSCALPKLRVFEHSREAEPEEERPLSEEELAQRAAARIKELGVREETELLPTLEEQTQHELEVSLSLAGAEGVARESFMVLVLPR